MPHVSPWTIFWASVAVAQAAVTIIYILLREKPRIDPIRIIESWEEE